MSYLRKVALVVGLALLFGIPAPIVASATPPGDWVGTWGASATGTVPNLASGYVDRTVRDVVHTSVGGSGVRVGLTNVLGTAPVLMGAVTVAVAARPDAPADAVDGSSRPRIPVGRPPWPPCASSPPWCAGWPPSGAWT